MQEFNLLINSISQPIKIALYQGEELYKQWSFDGYISDILVQELNKILKEYKIKEIIYVNGPGSYMGIKLTYIVLESIKIVEGIPFFGTLGFELNSNRPIKAMGKLYFIKEKENIITKKFDEAIEQRFILPERWAQIEKTKSNKPLYNIPAV